MGRARMNPELHQKLDELRDVLIQLFGRNGRIEQEVDEISQPKYDSYRRKLDEQFSMISVRDREFGIVYYLLREATYVPEVINVMSPQLYHNFLKIRAQNIYNNNSKLVDRIRKLMIGNKVSGDVMMLIFARLDNIAHLLGPVLNMKRTIFEL